MTKFSFCSDYYLRLTIHRYNGLEQRRSNILTIMSFCLIGEMTFCAARFADIQVNPLWIFMVSLQFAAWLFAFIIAINTVLNVREVFFYPGQVEGMHFVPSQEEIDEFMRSDVCYRDPELFLSKKYFERSDTPILKGNWDDESIYDYYAQEISGLNLNQFSKSVSLTSSLMSYLSAVKFTQATMRRFKKIYSLFYANLILFFVMVILMLLSNEPSVQSVMLVQ